MKRIVSIAVMAVCALSACRSVDRSVDPGDIETIGSTILLQDARQCDSGFTYPQALIDGLSTQLIEELRCLDDRWLEFYTPCQEVGCIDVYGPQPLALRPEVLVALRQAATSIDDYITISAGYRDVAMQYFSRWYKENCSSSFNAAIPGQSNHQGGRAIDVRFFDFWSDPLLANGFDHPIPTDAPHFELVEDAQFRQESEELKVLSITAFQRLWNRNNAGDMLDEDGMYGPTTKDRLGLSPIEGFDVGACEPGSGGDVGPTDTGMSDTGVMDTGTDTATEDTGTTDTTDDPMPGDADASEADTTDTNMTDIGGTDTSPTDTNPSDVDPADTDSDTDPDDTDQPDSTGPDVDNTDTGEADAAEQDVAITQSAIPLFSTMPDDATGATSGCAQTSGARTPAWMSFLFIGLLLKRRRTTGSVNS